MKKVIIFNSDTAEDVEYKVNKWLGLSQSATIVHVLQSESETRLTITVFYEED